MPIFTVKMATPTATIGSMSAMTALAAAGSIVELANMIMETIAMERKQQSLIILIPFHGVLQSHGTAMMAITITVAIMITTMENTLMSTTQMATQMSQSLNIQ